MSSRAFAEVLAHVGVVSALTLLLGLGLMLAARAVAKLRLRFVNCVVVTVVPVLVLYGGLKLFESILVVFLAAGLLWLLSYLWFKDSKGQRLGAFVSALIALPVLLFLFLILPSAVYFGVSAMR